MKKRRTGALMLSLALTLGLATSAFAAGGPGGPGGMPPDGMMMPGGPGGMPPDGMMMPGGPGSVPEGMAGMMLDGAAEKADLVIRDGAEVISDEYIPSFYSQYVSRGPKGLVVNGLNLFSNDYTRNGIVVTGEASDVTVQNSRLYYHVTETPAANTNGGVGLGVDKGGTLRIKNCDLTVDGSQRYVVAAYNDGTLVVNDSTVTSTGSNYFTRDVDEPRSNPALLISGNARTNFSVGASKTYYFNSSCIAEGWAALSTDSATGDGLDLYAYNTSAVAQNGGYATYADTNCRVWLYGSSLKAAEIGAIISNNGKIVLDNGAATPASVLAYKDSAGVNNGSTLLAGGRNALMIHSPDMFGMGAGSTFVGQFSAHDSVLRTTQELKSTKNYYDYGPATGAYIDYVSGAAILIRSTSADITLDRSKVESYTGDIIKTVLNADAMGNFLQDGDEVPGVTLNLNNMVQTGNVRHMDYQRVMNLNLNNTQLTGQVVSGTMADWNWLWKDYQGCSWVRDTEWNTVNGVRMSIDSGSSWTVSADSTLSSLTIQPGGSITGLNGAAVTMTVNGAVTPVAPGVYTGNIVLSIG